MNSEVRQLPIASEDATTPQLSFAGRLTRILTPNTRMKRWTYAGLIMAVFNQVNVIFLVLAIPMLTISGLYYIWHLARWLRARLLWKVRNRILASFVFVGIVPVCLVLLISVTIGWFLIGAMGANLTQQQFEYTTDRLGHLAQDIQLALYRTDDKGLLSFADPVNSVIQANQELQSLSIGIFEQQGGVISRLYARPENRVANALPAWTLSQPFTGVVIDSIDVNNTLTEFRAISGMNVNGRQLYVLAAMPLDYTYQTKIWEQTGVLLTSSLFSNRSIEAEWTKLPLGLGDLSLPWGSIFSTVKWDTGNDDNMFFSMRLDPVRIVMDTLSVDTGFIQLVLGALITLCAILAGVEFVSFFVGLVISRRITSAVHSLSRATQAIRSGNLSHRIETHRQDQLGELTSSFNDMAQSIQVLLNEVRDKNRIEAELEMAREVQARFLPKSPPVNGHLELAATWVPARTVSGDYYDFIEHENQVLDIVVSDISGKGMSAALMMAGLQSALRSQSVIGKPVLQPGRIAQLVSHLNQHLCLNTAPEKFATLFICSYDMNTSMMTYCCAGHNPPYLYQNGSNTQLLTGGCPIGLFSDWIYEEDTVKVGSGDLFVIYTDGITEAQNTEQKEFGEERLEQVIQDHKTSSCEEIQERILAAVRDFSFGAEQFDDQTVVVGRVL